jgi:eukaryotic-like serine/threonine-protein kinase
MSAPAENPDGPRNLAGRRLGRYEVITQLASGGMAAVYIARAQGVAGFERLVAIKVLHAHLAYEEEFISMFLDEARLAARIRHPNVVPTTDINDTGGDGYYLVMDYIEGDHLGGLLGRSAKQGKRIPVPIVNRVLLDSLAGLAAAHALTDEQGNPMNLVHRDISPHNVMVGTDGIARLTDFGVAKAEVRMSSTRAGQFKGKLSYMAPEQASTGDSTQVSDVFSMGIVLWESLTGRRLFRGQTNAQTLAKILQDPIPMPSEVWPDLEPFDPVLEKALARVPEQRYQSADEFIDGLEAVAQANGGIGTQRQVSQLVHELLAEKIEAERDRIKDAIAQLGQASMGETSLPIPRDGSSASSITHSGARPVGEGTQTGILLPGYEEQNQKNKQTAIIAAVVALAIVVGGGLVALSMLSSSEPEVAAPVVQEPLDLAPAAEEEEKEPAAQVVEAVEVAPEPEPEPVVEEEKPAPTQMQPVRRVARPATRMAPAPSSPAPTAAPSPEPKKEEKKPVRRPLLPSNPYGL